jgi:hypothetical protein
MKKTGNNTGSVKSFKHIANLLFVVILILFTACSKKDDTTVTKDTNTPTDTSQDENGYSESNEDLFKVDYDYFYKELSPHGEWVEVNAKDLGLDIKPGTTVIEGKTGYDYVLDVLGINTAYAQTDEQLMNIFVWRPAAELIQTAENETAEPQYVPYNNGQWINTEQGWYFKASTSAEDLTSHYGRWALDPNLGWVWLPGKVWAPAWVDWRENEDYAAWAPVPPGTYIINDVLNVSPLDDNRFTVVEKRYLVEPSVYKYRYQVVENKNKIMIKEMTKINGVMIMNKTVINRGPDVAAIETKSGKKIEKVKIKRVGSNDGTGFSAGQLIIYTPKFKTEKTAKKEPLSKPQKLVAYKDAKRITKDEKDALKEQDKNMKENEKEMKKEEKEKEKNVKKEEKENKKEEKDNGKKEKGNDKEKPSKEKNNDNGKEKKDKGKK